MNQIVRPDDIPKDIWKTAVDLANAVGAGLAIGSQETLARALLAERRGDRTPATAPDTPAGKSGPPAWLGTTAPRDWLINGDVIRSGYYLSLWAKLDWSRARMDMGPSPSGNPGPYWHVPWDHDGEELWARLYPKILQTKWLPVIREAINAGRRAAEAGN